MAESYVEEKKVGVEFGPLMQCLWFPVFPTDLVLRERKKFRLMTNQQDIGAIAYAYTNGYYSTANISVVFSTLEWLIF